MKNFVTVKKSRKAIVVTMLATVMIFGTVITAFAASKDKPQDQAKDLGIQLKEVSNLINAAATYEPGETATIKVKPNQLAAAGITGTEGVDYHFEWYCENVSAPEGVTVATINRKTGILNVSSYDPAEGETLSAEITVYVVKGSEYETGSGSGSGSGSGNGPWYPTVTVENGVCNILAYSEATFTVESTSTSTYGWQGTGGLQMLMTNPSDIDVSGSISGVTGIVNTIKNSIAVTDGTAQFKLQLSGGLNTESAFKDNGNVEEIHVYEYSRGSLGSELGNAITYGGTDTKTSTVTIKASGLTSGKQYVIEFGSAIKGNNASKTLGTNIYFIFRAQ